MDVSKYYNDFRKLLVSFKGTPYMGMLGVTQHLTSSDFKQFGIGEFYKSNKLYMANDFNPDEYVDILKDEHPAICGGVTEYITKIRLARRAGLDLEVLGFIGNPDLSKYTKLSDEELAFAMYELDIMYRSGFGYTPEIKNHKSKIISKALILSDIALSLIDDKFPTITNIDFHPEGHATLNGEIAIKGDSDLMINNNLIDFKTKKDYKLQSKDAAQMFAYAINRYSRTQDNYSGIYVLNPRYRMLEELVLEKPKKK